MELKQPLSIEEQILKLKDHDIIVNDDAFASSILSKISYYRLSGYALQYRKDINSSDLAEAITFEHLYNIYCFDKKLRIIIRKHIEVCEIYYRTQIANGFALRECINPPHNQHYDGKNFYRKNVHSKVINKFKKEKDYYKDGPIVKHHIAKYEGKMPLWVMTELFSLSNLSMFYSAMYDADKEFIAKNCGTTSKVLENHLHCLSVLRNRCAHCSRLYNSPITPPVRLTKNFLIKHPEIDNKHLSAYLIMLAQRLPDHESRLNLFADIENLLENHSYDIDLTKIGINDGFLDLLLSICQK